MDELKPMAERTHAFQCAVIDEFRRNPPRDKAEQLLWEELLKTARSMANNSGESGGSQSRRDFITKFQICLKESREAMQTLRALIHACATHPGKLNQLFHACDEIISILVKSLKTAKANEDREKRRKNRT